MTMGFGCNAAGVVATRIIDSPRERLIAIITNNFALCNGRWPTQILIATIFIGALVPPALGGLVSALAVVGDRRAGRRSDVCRLVGAVAHGAQGRGLDVQPRTAAVSPAAHLADDLHLDDRPHADRAVARDQVCGPGGRADLADRQRHDRRREHRRAHGQSSQPDRRVDRFERRHPGRVHRRHPGQRDRHPHRADADRAGHTVKPAWARARA